MVARGVRGEDDARKRLRSGQCTEGCRHYELGNVVTATPDTPLGKIAALLERHHIKRVPVVRNGKVVGIVSRANLIQALASIRKKISIATASGDLGHP